MPRLLNRLILGIGVLCAAPAWAHAASAVPNSGLSPSELTAGWIRLFDGSTLYGWRANSDMNWTVRDGVIRADRGTPGLLVTSFQLADYELRCDYRLAPGGNSGIFLRTPFAPKDPTKDCYELNMCDSHPAYPTGSIVGRKRAVGVFRGEGEWMTFKVRVEGNRITARLNDRPVVDFTDTLSTRRRSGHIGLQMNGGAVEFRNVLLRPLSMHSLFNGRDLTGWHAVPGAVTRFDVVDQTIHLKNGPGYLESDAAFDDFALQFEAKTNGRHLNSGLFFRAMPGTAKAPSNGYELQIQNGYRNGDRTAPLDAGTGAIYRRTKARFVIPDDGRWFAATLITNGPHVAVWIDGIQVTDWTDERSDDPNPRRGRRLAAGRFLLQGHDKTTDLNFRALRIAAVPREP